MEVYMEDINVSKDLTKRRTLFFNALKKGDLLTKLSFIIMGFGCFLRGQIVKGLIYLALQVSFIAYITGSGWYYLSNLSTLGKYEVREVWNEELQIFEYEHGDNSMLILLFGVVTIFACIALLVLYVKSVTDCYRCELLRKSGKRPSTFKEDVKDLFDKNFHKTLLTLPTLGVILTVIMPLIFMVLMAFTNFDKDHQPPGKLFTWVGLENFRNLFWNNSKMSGTFGKIIVWTFIWAVFATFTNYLFGMILAIMINKKGIKYKGFWRTIFVITIAVPQFVTLMLMQRMFQDLGPVNLILNRLGFSSVKFLTNGTNAKIFVILVNMWVGIPYTMLITSGILMNIPEELYESAKIDGAGPVTAFMKITLPYMLFVTTPYLITQFVGNLNNFNVIYLLTGGGPNSLDYFQAGETDLLVTWLYKLTVNSQNYSLASTISIIVFVISATFSLIAYNRSASVQKEDTFQ